jgi:hypothetical protein
LAGLFLLYPLWSYYSAKVYLTTTSPQPHHDFTTASLFEIYKSEDIILSVKRGKEDRQPDKMTEWFLDCFTKQDKIFFLKRMFETTYF